MAKTKRIVVRVRPQADGWWFRDPRGVVHRYHRKRFAVFAARLWARREWEAFGRPSQLVVHNKNSRIAFEHTYGADPRRRKG